MARSAAVQGRLVRLVTENLPYKVLSLFLAVATWAWVQADEVVEARTRVQVRYAWPDGLVRARQVPKTLVVTVSGPQGVVRTIQRDQLTIDVDLAEAEQGSVPVDFTELELVGLPPGVEVVQISPPAIDVELDRALTREVEVRPTVIGEPRDGWVLGAIQVEPATVHITGPQDKVKDIAQVATDVVDVSNLRGDVQTEVGLATNDRVVALADDAPARVRVTVRVDPVIAERTFEEVPVVVRGEGAWLAAPSVARVVLSGPQEEVANIGLDKVMVVLEPPGEVPADGRLELTWRRGAEDDRVSIIHDGPADAVEVVRVDPRRFVLGERQ